MRVQHVVRTESHWKELRREVITATEVASVLGLNKYRSPMKMWEEKELSSFTGNGYTEVGEALESVVLRFTNRILGTTFELYEKEPGVKHFFVLEEARLGATPDATDGASLLECKTSGSHNILSWQYIPNLQYLAQLYAQLLCTDFKSGMLSCLSTDLSQCSQDLKLDIAAGTIARNSIIDDIILSELQRFWSKVMQGKAFRVNRTLTKELEWRLLLAYQRVIPPDLSPEGLLKVKQGLDDLKHGRLISRDY